MATYTISYNETVTYWVWNGVTWISGTVPEPGPVIGPFHEPNSGGGPDNINWAPDVGSGDIAIGVVSGGGFSVVAGGIAQDVTIQDEGQNDTYLTVSAGGLAIGTTVESGAWDFVSGGTASGTTVNSGGNEDVDFGGSATGTTVNKGGEQFVANGGAASGTIVHAFGTQFVGSDGSTSGTIVSFESLEDVASGGTAFNTTIEGGVLDLESGGTASGSITFKISSEGSVGTLEVDGTTMPTAVISGFTTGEDIYLATIDANYTEVNSYTYSAGVLTLYDSSLSGPPLEMAALNIQGGYASNSFVLTKDREGVDITLGGSLFTTGADTVDFNALTSDQQAAIAGGADIYHGLGGNDVVTLPSKANYNERVGGGKTLGWTNTTASTFYTGSQAGNTYKVNGRDGNYYIQEGSGTETITINGDGSSTIIAGSGNDTISITGNGANNITIGSGTDNVTISGSGANTIAAGTSSAGITITNFSDSLTGSAPSPSPGATITLTGADTGNTTIGSNSTLELGAGSSLNGTLAFGSTAGGTLKIDQPLDFNIPISGLQVGDTIDVTDSIKSEAIDGNNLLLCDIAGNTFDYQIAGNISGKGFLISSDRSGGSDLTLQAPPALDDQSNELAGKIIDAVQAARDAFLKGTSLALETGEATELLEASDTLAKACLAAGVGINVTIAGATLVDSLSKAKSAQDRYNSVETFDISITNTILKAGFVYMAGVSAPAFVAGVLEGLFGTAAFIGITPFVATALAGVALGLAASAAYDTYLKPIVTEDEQKNFESAHPPPTASPHQLASLLMAIFRARLSSPTLTARASWQQTTFRPPLTPTAISR
jgi:autotransporter passenger strand-loop-strand repeat protein